MLEAKMRKQEARALAKKVREEKRRRELGAFFYERNRMRKEMGPAYFDDLTMQFAKHPGLTSNPGRYKKR